MTSVLKKQSPNGRLSLYLSGREFFNEGGVVKPIDGVVVIDPANVRDKKVFAIVVLTFRYGREDEEVMGLKFFTEAILDFKQVYPQNLDEKDDLTPVQQNLIKKLGNDAYPLTLNISSQAPHSVRLRPARLYHGSPLGVTYELKVFVGNRPDDRPNKRGMVRLSLRCVHLVTNPDSLLSNPNSMPPTASTYKSFVFSPGKLEIKAVLDREVYYMDDPLHVHVTVNNGCNRTVHKIRVLVIQHVNVCMFTNGHFKNIVGLAETEERHPISPGSSLSRDFCIKLLGYVKYPVALAVEGGVSDESLVLAPSTLPQYVTEKNPYGVTVLYEVKVKAVLGYVDRPITLRLPFKLFNNSLVRDQPGTSSVSGNQTFVNCDEIEPANDYLTDDGGSVELIST